MPSLAENMGDNGHPNLPGLPQVYIHSTPPASSSSCSASSTSSSSSLSLLPSQSSQMVPPLVHQPDWVEYVSGGGAAFINITMTFPLHKVLFRQQLHGIRAKKALRQMHREGFRHLYRGVLPPLMQKTCSVSLMFGAYEHFSRIFSSEVPTMGPTAVLCTAAILSGTCEALLVPFERVQTLLQDHRHSETFKNTPQALRRLYTYGPREYYRGLTAVLLRNGPSNVVFFSVREKLRKALPEPTTDAGKVANDFISGAILGALLSTVWYPVNVVKTRMQSKVGGKFHSFPYTFKVIYNERGRRWRAMFYGVHLNFSRALISWGIINASYEMLKSFLTPFK